MNGDQYIIVEGGLVQNDPALPVFDFDVLDGSFIDNHDREYVEDLVDRMTRVDPVALEYYIQRCNDWLDRHGRLSSGGEDLPDE